MKRINRRKFVNISLSGTTAAATLASPRSASLFRTSQAPGERVVLALIGAGGRGRYLARNFAEIDNVEVKWTCDVEDSRANESALELEKIQGYAPKTTREMKEVLDDPDVDGVVIGTPEQWHALATIWSCQAGKHVLVEKNVCLGIWEGRKMIEASRKYNRVVQAGFQCRSAPYVYSAREYIQSGGLGKVLYAKVFGMLPFVYGGYPQERPPDSSPPADLDWDLWLGPAKKRPYNEHLHRQWYGYWDFSGGNASDAIHTLDVARLVLGDPPHPKSVVAIGGRWGHQDGGQMPDVEIVTFEFDQMVLTFENTGFTPYLFKTPKEIRFSDRFPNWPFNSSRIELYGTDRMMYLGRHGGGWQVIEGAPTELGTGNAEVVAEEPGMFPDQPHMVNCVESIRGKEEPKGDIGKCHYSASLEIMANTAYRVGNRHLQFDGRNEVFTNNEKANTFLKTHYRGTFRVPEQV